MYQFFLTHPVYPMNYIFIDIIKPNSHYCIVNFKRTRLHAHYLVIIETLLLHVIVLWPMLWNNYRG